MIRRVAYGLLGALLALAALTVRVNAQGVTIVPLPRTFGASTFSGTSGRSRFYSSTAAL